MKLYCIAVIDEATGEVWHMAVSDAPLVDKQVPSYPDPHHLNFFEFEVQSFMRARDVLALVEVAGATPADKRRTTSKIKLRAGESLQNIVIGVARKRR